LAWEILPRGMCHVTDVELGRYIYVLEFAIEVPDKPEFIPIFIEFEVVER
jgi:hypothetical protein